MASDSERQITALEVKMDIMLASIKKIETEVSLLNELKTNLALSIADRGVMHDELREVKTCVDQIKSTIAAISDKTSRLDTGYETHDKIITSMQNNLTKIVFLLVGGIIAALLEHFVIQ